MNKAFIIAKREYAAAVRTKGFLISLILLPIFMGGGFAVFTLMKDKIDISDKRIAIIDHTGIFAEQLVTAAKNHNQNNIKNEEGEKIASAYSFEIIKADTISPHQQKLELSQRVRAKDIHAFLQIGSDVVHPTYGEENSRIYYYAENSAIDNVRSWLNNIINGKIREARILELELEKEQVQDLFYWVGVEGMGLLSIDSKTGQVKDATKTNELETIMVPYILMLLMFMMLMMSAIPLLSAVMEEKSERIAEVLLGSVTPAQFMVGKIIGSVGVSLTISVIYVAGSIFTLRGMDFGNLIPYDVLPWFFIFMFLNIIMVGSIMAALGSACNDSKDVQAIQFPAMLPIIIPLIVMMPIILNPLSNFATGMSLFPLWTPMLMVLRLATSVTIPAWQPYLGLFGVIVFTVLSVWAGARIFRSAIIMQGKRPKIGTLLRYIFKG
ncbi:MAG: ABC transporter permease [Bacteroidales bacterium]|nr:ABC transporter permease [Bacteroidales bacterium]